MLPLRMTWTGAARALHGSLQVVRPTRALPNYGGQSQILHQLVDGLAPYNPIIYNYLECFIVTHSCQLVQDFCPSTVSLSMGISTVKPRKKKNAVSCSKKKNGKAFLEHNLGISCIRSDLKAENWNEKTFLNISTLSFG